MASSMLPYDFLDVPAPLLRLNPNVVSCNPRPDKRPDLKGEVGKLSLMEKVILAQRYGIWSRPIHTFLDKLRAPERVVVHFQGPWREKGRGTMVVDIGKTFWADENWGPENRYPRIAIPEAPLPGIYRKLMGGMNLWGAYVLAIARVQKATKPFGTADARGAVFAGIASDSGVAFQ